jgi:Rrf2 family nitric oxide-sensitive transcriptional repressor
LARVPGEIRVGAVIQAFEGNLHLLECVGMDNVCVIQPHCKLRGVLAEAERIQMEYLNKITLSDVLPIDADPKSARAGRPKVMS